MAFVRGALSMAVGFMLALPQARAQPAASPAPSLEQLRRACPTSRNLAFGPEAPLVEPSMQTLDAEAARIRGPVPTQGAPSDAAIVLRAFAPPSFTQSERSETTTEVWRMPDGRWHFVAIDYFPHRLLPPAPPGGRQPSVEQLEILKRTVRSGLLDSIQAARLDTILADPCLEAEPHSLGLSLDVREGVQPTGMCYDAVPQVLEIRRGADRSLFRQYCNWLLAGEANGIVLYPRTEDTGRAAREASWTIASPEEARTRGDRMIAAYRSGAVWQNISTTRTTELLHQPSGFRCAFDWDPSASVFGPSDWEPQSISGNCYLRRGQVQTRTIIRRPLPGRDLRYVLMDAGPQRIGEAWRERPSRTAIGSVRLDGRQVSRVAAEDIPQADARQEEPVFMLGALIDGWIVVVASSGRAPMADLEVAATAEWRRLLSTRAPSVTAG